MNDTMYYNHRTLEGYNAPINVVIAKRGIGKTFGRVKKRMFRFMEHGKRFIYVVETEDMVQELSQNRGEKFFSKIIEYLQLHPSNRNTKLLNFMLGSAEVTEGDVLNKIKGGTIIVSGQTAGYIISLNGFAKLKRNNFVNVEEIIVDEFIPETIDVRSLKNTYKLVSIVQSIARLENIKVWLLGNAIRLNDNILVKLKLTNLKLGEIRKVYDKYGLLVVCHYVDNSQYKKFSEVADKSVAGRLANLTGENNEEENTFKDDMPKELAIPVKMKGSHLICCIHGEMGSVRIHSTQDHSEYYCLEDYGSNKRNRFCFEEKYCSPFIQYSKEWKDYCMWLYTSKKLKFENSIVYTIFKSILKLDLNS